MTEDQQKQLSALLRLKRYEQPPPGYFDKLLQDVHRRQRADMLKRPAWKLWMERVGTFFSEHSIGYGTYASAATAVVIAGLAIFGSTFTGKPGSTRTAPVIAKQTTPVNLLGDGPRTENLLSLQGGARFAMVGLPEVDNPAANARLFPSTVRHERSVNGQQRRYVIDAIPVSYDATQVSF